MYDDAPPSSLAVSFLDVLCCGLGGAIALFLVFSALPHRGDSTRILGGNTAGGTTLGISELSSSGRHKGEASPVEIVLEIPSSAGIAEFSDLLTFEGGHSLARKLSREQAVVTSRTQTLLPDGSVRSYVVRYSVAGGQRAGRKIKAVRAESNGPIVPTSLNITFAIYVGGDVTKGRIEIDPQQLGTGKATLLEIHTSGKTPEDRVESKVGIVEFAP